MSPLTELSHSLTYILSYWLNFILWLKDEVILDDSCILKRKIKNNIIIKKIKSQKNVGISNFVRYKVEKAASAVWAQNGRSKVLGKFVLSS